MSGREPPTSSPEPASQPAGSSSAPPIAFGRIRTPLRIQWQRFCQSALPLLAFVGGVLLCGFLWREQTQAVHLVGEVEATRHIVSAATNGRLVEIAPQHRWTLFDRVEAGDLIARLDDKALLLQIETLKADLSRLQAEASAEAAKLEFEQTDLSQEHSREVTRLLWQHQRRRLLVLDRKVLLETDRITEQRLRAVAERVEKLLPGRNTSQLEVIIAQKDLEQLTQRIATNQAALDEEELQVEQARERLESNPDLKLPSVETLLAPHAAALKTQEARIAELRHAINGLELRAPYAGTIVSITAEPGQSIRVGDPVLTLAARNGRYVIAYLRQQEGRRPQLRDLVELRPQGPTVERWQSEVEEIGPQFEPIPPHLLRDPRLPEWGLPIRIALLEQVPVRPGELLNVAFKPASPSGTR